MTLIEIIQGLCRVIEELLRLVGDSAEAISIREEYKRIMGEEEIDDILTSQTACGHAETEQHL